MYLNATTRGVADGPDRNGSDWTARNGVWPPLVAVTVHNDTQWQAPLGRTHTPHHPRGDTVVAIRDVRPNIRNLDKALLNGVRPLAASAQILNGQNSDAKPTNRSLVFLVIESPEQIC